MARAAASDDETDSNITIDVYSELWLGGMVGIEIPAVGLVGCEDSVWGVPRTSTASTSRRTTPETSSTRSCGSPKEELLLGGGGSGWLWNGASADAWVVLYAYGWKGGRRIDTRSSLRRLPHAGRN